MLSNDWVVKNWDFLKSRFTKVVRGYRFIQDFIQDSRVPTSGKFWGDYSFLQESNYKALSVTGTHRLCLRPYIVAPIPEEGIRAVYIDPKKYKFDEEERITGLSTLYEPPIVIFKD